MPKNQEDEEEEYYDSEYYDSEEEKNEHSQVTPMSIPEHLPASDMQDYKSLLAAILQSE